jgi:4-hydroxybenzoate polyprenyltransferase
MPAVLRVIHPAPAAAVVLLSALLGGILLLQDGQPLGVRWWLTVAAVAGSQAFTGAVNDLADAARDAASGRREKPIPSGALSPAAARAASAAGLVVQLAASLPLGWPAIVLGLVAVGSATAYNLVLSRTPLSPLPYLVSFGVLPLWIASGVGVEAARVLPAVPLAALFAVAAHLANTLRDFDADVAAGSRCLAQLLGRRATHLLAVAILAAVGLGVGVALLLGGRAGVPTLLLGLLGLGAVLAGARSERGLWYAILVTAVAWAAAWATSTG